VNGEDVDVELPMPESQRRIDPVEFPDTPRSGAQSSMFSAVHPHQAETP
jgi:hypothetical protein